MHTRRCRHVVEQPAGERPVGLVVRILEHDVAGVHDEVGRVGAQPVERRRPLRRHTGGSREVGVGDLDDPDGQVGGHGHGLMRGTAGVASPAVLQRSRDGRRPGDVPRTSPPRRRRARAPGVGGPRRARRHRSGHQAGTALRCVRRAQRDLLPADGDRQRALHPDRRRHGDRPAGVAVGRHGCPASSASPTRSCASATDA